jgi:hypothetical protein
LKNTDLNYHLQGCHLIFFLNSFFLIFFVVPHLAAYIFFSFLIIDEPELGAGIDPGMALTPFPSRIGQDLKP